MVDDMIIKSPADREPELKDLRRPYKPPTLTRWGTLSEITKQVGRTGSNDHGDPGHGRVNKTRA